MLGKFKNYCGDGMSDKKKTAFEMLISVHFGAGFFRNNEHIVYF